MASRTKFPDGVTTVGGASAAFGAVQALFFFVVEVKTELATGEFAESFSLSQARFILYLHIILSLALIFAGISLRAKRHWAWWASLALLAAAAIASGVEVTSIAATEIQAATSLPEPLASGAVLLFGLALMIALVNTRPRSLKPARRVAEVEEVDPRALAALEATRKMASRRTEDWGADEDNEELLESLVWMAQMRQTEGSEETENDEAARKEEMDRRIDRLPVVIDASPMAIAVCDKLGKVTLWNTAAQRLLGFSQLEVLGEPVRLGELDGGLDPAGLLARAAEDGAVMGIGSMQTTKTGTVMPVSMSISALPDITGGVGGFMLVMADASARVATADESDQTSSVLAGLTDDEWANSAHGQHARRVTIIAQLVALELGFSDGDAAKIGRASMPHDIGKVGVSGEVWSKKGKLTDEEFDKVKTHAKIGGDMLSSTQSPLLKMAADIAYSHHERWDGDGYLGLRGEEIPIGARIVAVADAFDALTHDRPYRTARTVEYAVAEITRESGHQFDPRVVAAFLRILDEGRMEPVLAGVQPR